jgi:hypothetical protein
MRVLLDENVTVDLASLLGKLDVETVTCGLVGPDQLFEFLTSHDGRRPG